MEKDEAVYKTSLLLVQHFRNMNSHSEVRKKKSLGQSGFHTRVFSHMLHPEKEFVFLGISTELKKDERHHPEHVVPCVVLITECRRLIEESHPDEYIAKLLQKHWKVAHITKEQAKKLDEKPLSLKSSMPDGWNFETGDTLARLEKAGIVLKSCE